MPLLLDYNVLYGENEDGDDYVEETEADYDYDYSDQVETPPTTTTTITTTTEAADEDEGGAVIIGSVDESGQELRPQGPARTTTTASK